jgi:hypothetical protein
MLQALAVSIPLLAAPLAGQAAAPPATSEYGLLEPGARVRATAAAPERARMVGTVLRVDSVGLVLDPDGPVPRAEVAWSEIGRLDVSAGRDSFRNALLGLGAGAVMGGVVYRVRADARTSNDEWNGMTALVRGAPIGALAGFLIGSTFRSERWRRVDGASGRTLRVTVLPRGIAVGIAL